MDDMLKQRREERQLLRAKGILPPEPELPSEDASKAANSTKLVEFGIRVRVWI